MRQNVMFRSHARHGKRTDWRMRGLLLAFFLFVAGGLYFGYIFVSIAVELVELETGADLPNPPPPPAVGPVNPNPKPAPTPAVVNTPPRSGERINVLLLGLDQRGYQAGEPSRTDTMIVASIDPRSQTAALLSIPRDLWAAIPKMDGTFEYNKINTGHFWGQYWHYPDGKNPDGGPELAKRTVEYNLGIRIHYYARINFSGFEKAVDMVDGIDVDVPQEIIDTAYPLDDDQGVITVHFLPGLQHMDGATALRYARTRHQDSDFGRMARQRQVLLALRDRALRLDLLPKLPQLIGLMRDSFDTDMPLDQMINLANIARNIKAEDIASYAIDATMVVPDQPVVGVLYPKQAEIQKLISKVFFDSLLRDEAATVEVQNGTLKDGLASETATLLGQRGFQVARVRQAESSDYDQTEIYNYSQKDYTVQQLASVLHVSPANIHKTAPPAGADVDVRVILGKDALQSMN